MFLELPDFTQLTPDTISLLHDSMTPKTSKVASKPQYGGD